MQAGRLHFIRSVVTFPSSYSNDPILIHTGTSSNRCQVSDFYIHQQSTSNKPWRPSITASRDPGCVSSYRDRKGETAYLLNWDGSTAPDAVRPALQAFFLFVWVTPFPRLQSKNKVSIWGRAAVHRSWRWTPICTVSAKHTPRSPGWAMCVPTCAHTTQEQTAGASISTEPSRYREFSKLFFLLFRCKIIF